MKKMRLILVALGMMLCFTACGVGASNTFYCDFCGEEKTGKKYVSNSLGEELTMCQECRDDINGVTHDDNQSGNNQSTNNQAGNNQGNNGGADAADIDEVEVKKPQILPEIENGSLEDYKVQIWDVVLSIDCSMTEADVKAALDKSEYDLVYAEVWDGDYVIIRSVECDGTIVSFEWATIDTPIESEVINAYTLCAAWTYSPSEYCWGTGYFDSEDFTNKTRDDVVNCLEQKGFKEEEVGWIETLRTKSYIVSTEEYNDLLQVSAYYVADGAKSITAYFSAPLSDVKYGDFSAYSDTYRDAWAIQAIGYRTITFEFNPDGSIKRVSGNLLNGLNDSTHKRCVVKYSYEQ